MRGARAVVGAVGVILYTLASLRASLVSDSNFIFPSGLPAFAWKPVALVSASAISIEQAIGVARSSVGGTVFDAKLKEIEQRLVWRVKLVVDGHRVKIHVDARSGCVINAKVEILDHERFSRDVLPSREYESSLGA